MNMDHTRIVRSLTDANLHANDVPQFAALDDLALRLRLMGWPELAAVAKAGSEALLPPMAGKIVRNNRGR